MRLDGTVQGLVAEMRGMHRVQARLGRRVERPKERSGSPAPA
jgi:hypothetical protein